MGSLLLGMTALSAVLLYLVPFEAGFFLRLIRFREPTLEDNERLPVKTVKAGSFTPLKKTETSHVNIDTELRELLKRDQSVLFLIAHRDEIIFEEYFEPDASVKILNTFSIAKSFTSFLVGAAIDRGFIQSLDQKGSEFIHEWRDQSDRENISVRDLLTMRSGLDWSENVPPFHWDLLRSYYAVDLWNLILKRKSAKKPGENWSYSGADATALGVILEKASGKALPQLATEWLWEPLGAESDARWATDFSGKTTKAFSNFFATGRDLLRFGIMIANEGNVNGISIGNPGYLREMTSAIVDRTEHLGEQGVAYGYQWWIHNSGDSRVVMARGYKGQLLLIDPVRKIVVVRLAREGDHLSRDLIKAVRSRLSIWVGSR